MVTSDDLESIESAADELEPWAVEFLREMIRTPSVNPPGDYTEILDLVVSTYEGLGWETEVVWAPDDLVAELGLEHPRPNVLAYPTRGDGPTIALNAHLDTVPADTAEWTHDPFAAEVEDGHVWGRGAKDSKGRIAGYTLAARALEEADLVPDATVVLAITADEETGGQAGPEYVIESGALDPDYAIVEGHHDEVHYASNGVLHLRVSLSGRAVHAGTQPEKGANALVGAARVIAAIEEYGRELEGRESGVAGIPYPTCTPATIEGGSKTNVVPSSCSFTVDRRVNPDEEIGEAEREFREVVAGVDLPAGVSAEVETILRAEPFVSDRDGPHVRALERNAEAVMGIDVPVVGSRGFTDARFFARVAATAKYGPGDDASNAHGADENLSIRQLRDAGAVVAASLRDIAEEG